MSKSDKEDRRTIYHRLRGARVLEDKRAERVAWLLSDPLTENDVFTCFPELTPANLDALKLDEFFARRLHFIKNRSYRRPPKTYDHYEEFALKKLHKLAESAGAEKDQISAAAALGRLAKDLKKNAKGEPERTDIPSETTAEIEELKKLYGEDK